MAVEGARVEGVKEPDAPASGAKTPGANRTGQATANRTVRAEATPTGARAAADRTMLGSVRNAARVLRAFSSADQALGAADIARRLGLSKSTAHRLLSTLAAERLLEQDPQTGKYRPGLALYELGSLVPEHADLHAAALPVLTTLRHRTGEMVHVAVLDGLEVVYVERLESNHLLPVFRQVGHRLAAHWTSSGKVLLASLPRAGLLRRLEGAELEVRTPYTIRTVEVLLAELDKAAERGWASNVDEGHVGITSVGAPMRGADGRTIAAVSVVGSSSRITARNMSAYASLAVEAAGVISRRLGHRP
jgi:IclR family acetate operon transcriptional repressor